MVRRYYLKFLSLVISMMVCCGCAARDFYTCDSDGMVECLSSGRIENSEEAENVYKYCLRENCEKRVIDKN